MPVNHAPVVIKSQPEAFSDPKAQIEMHRHKEELWRVRRSPCVVKFSLFLQKFISHFPPILLLQIWRNFPRQLTVKSYRKLLYLPIVVAYNLEVAGEQQHNICFSVRIFLAHGQVFCSGHACTSYTKSFGKNSLQYKTTF